MCTGVYELYFSLLRQLTKQTYDMYTVCPHTFKHRYKNRGPVIDDRRLAVGITTGFAEIDVSNNYSFNGCDAAKAAREGFFPIQLLETAVTFKCRDVEASVPKDRKTF